MALASWSWEARAPEPLIAGACLGLLDGILGLLGRRRTLPHLRKAVTFGAAISAYFKSRWTNLRDVIAITLLVFLDVLLSRRLVQPAPYTAFVLFASYFGVSGLFRALILAPWGESRELPANTSFERTREG
jgi:hypothetical protein